MFSVAKMFLGVAVRHYATAMLAVLLAKHWLTDAQAMTLGQSIVHQLSDDWVGTVMTSGAAAVIPSIAALWVRFKSKLKEKIALWLPQNSTPEKVKNLYDNTSLPNRIAAVVTQNPDHIG